MKEAHVVFKIHAQVSESVLEHCDTFNAQAESKTGNFFGVVAYGAEHRRYDRDDRYGRDSRRGRSRYDRDSFASSLAPLLVSGYRKITLVDLRYISGDMIGNFIDFKDQDVLFLYSTLILNNSLSLK